MTGWSTITALCPDEEDADLLAAEFECWTEPLMVEQHDRVVKARFYGYPAENDAQVALEDNANLWDTAVRIDANDTVDAGDGYAFVSDPDTGAVDLIDSANGVEGARAHDVAADLGTHVERDQAFVR